MPASMQLNIPTAGSGAAFENEFVDAIRRLKNVVRVVKKLSAVR